MKNTSILLVLATIAICTLSLPYRDQLALVNSLQVGRLEDPMDWTCVGCDESNKPLTSVVVEDKVKQIRSILSVYDEYTVLAFRYTANLKNLWQDILWAFQTQDEHAAKGCKVQREYDRMWNTIRDDVLEGLKKSVHTKRLVITGISLGGGLACISYVDIAKSGLFESVEVVTYGAPRVGNKAWARWFDAQTQSTRYYINNDPIAFLPRCLTPICNYRQTGTPIVCYKGRSECVVHFKRDEAEEMTLTADVWNTFTQELAEHMEEEGDNVDGIIDHIYGYKKIRDYTLIQ